MCFDPSSVHGGNCDRCDARVQDNELDLRTYGRMELCGECYDAAVEADETDDDHTFDADLPEWLEIAADIHRGY